MVIAYSRGRDKFDSKPRQQSAPDFAAFIAALDRDRSPAKGRGYICGPFNGDGTRCRDGALPRRFLCVDFDRIAAEALPDLRLWLARFSGVAWPTHSSTADAPRERVILELSRDVTREEGLRIGAALSLDLGEHFGNSIDIDSSTYRAEQPSYLAPVGVTLARFDGEPLDVDAWLTNAPQVEADGPARSEKLRQAIGDDPVLAHLAARGMVKQQKASGEAWIVCPFEADHTSKAEPFGTVYFPAHTGGFKAGHFKCLHSHCAGRVDADYLERIGFAAQEAPRATEREPATFRLLDIVALARQEPVPPQFIIPDWLPCGEVSLLAGHGGGGKSAIALMLAICVAAGRPFYGLHVQRRRVAFVSLEDGEQVLHWRLSRACAWLGVDLAPLAGWLSLFDASSAEAALIRDTREGAELTPAYDNLQGLVAGFGGLIVDGASDAFDCNENERRSVRKFIRALRNLVPADGFVLLLAHVDKFTARGNTTSQAYSGSTAWSNSVRARWFLQPETEADESDLLLTVQKANHAKAGAQLRLQWNDAAHVFTGVLSMPASKLERDMAESDERTAVLRCVESAHAAGDPIPTAKRGDRTAYDVASLRPEWPASLNGKRGKAAFYAHLERLRAAKKIRTDAVTRPNRHKVEVYEPAAPATERAPATEQVAPDTEQGAPATDR